MAIQSVRALAPYIAEGELHCPRQVKETNELSAIFIAHPTRSLPQRHGGHGRCHCDSMSDRDELATSPPLAPASSPKKKRKRKRPAEEEAEVEPPVAMTPDDSLVLVKPKKKKRKVEAVAEAVDEVRSSRLS